VSLQPLQDSLLRALRLLRASGARGAFGGGLAVIVWGRPRVTQDLDLLVDLDSERAERLLALAAQQGYRFDFAEAALLLEGGFLRLEPVADPPIALDLLVADTPLHQQALARARVFELAGEQVPVLTAEDLILLKLVAFRPKDTFDLETVIDAMGDRLDLPYLRAWADRLRLRERLETFLVVPTDGQG